MYQIGLLNKISKIGLDKFTDQYTCSEELANADAIMVRSAAMHDMELSESVKCVARAGAGVNNIPVDAYAQKGVVVFNTPGANANAVKELVLLGLLICSRKIPAAMEWIKTLKGEGDAVSKLVEKGKSQFVGPELKGKKLGVIGLGAIGALVCNAAVHFGMEVYGYDPFLSVDSAWRLSRSVKHATSLDDIYKNCDYVTLHLPCTKETKGMINADTIATMKDGVRILNFARGELVDEAAILSAIESGKAAAYVTDFATDAMLCKDGIIAFPHLGASTPESEDNCAMMAAEEIMEYLQNGNIINSVNMPNAVMARSGHDRICVIHNNVNAMLSKISTAVSEKGLNIENMVNKSRGDYAYTMIDVDGNVSDIADVISAIDGVIRVRLV